MKSKGREKQLFKISWEEGILAPKREKGFFKVFSLFSRYFINMEPQTSQTKCFILYLAINVKTSSKKGSRPFVKAQ